jgi:hypothetical protein
MIDFITDNGYLGFFLFIAGVFLWIKSIKIKKAINFVERRSMFAINKNGKRRRSDK